MIIDILIPSPGESITEVVVAKWLVENGSIVAQNDEIAEIESEKATLPLIAQAGGKISILLNAGETVKIGAVACKIDSDAAGIKTISKPEVKTVEAKPAQTKIETKPVANENTNIKVTPVAQKMMDENNISVDDIIAGLQRISKYEVDLVLKHKDDDSLKTQTENTKITREINRENISPLRKKLSQRLVAVKNETAMLTTFNEVDMTEISELRKKHQQAFQEKFGTKIGFMSFFTKAVCVALQTFPNVNSQIDGDELVHFNYCDVAIAVQTPKGLMVPVLRNADKMSLAEIEKTIAELAAKARNGRISMDEMTGGSFTITNGGIFGSLLSTPIINPPQSAILGMHNIVDRPVAVNGKVEIKPMMYIALSYDHRVIDGKDSVGFLVKIKELIEKPYKMLYGGRDMEKTLLGI